MKRRLLKVVVFLLLGAIVNVAIAWACVVLVPSQYTYFRQFTAQINSTGFVWTPIDASSEPSSNRASIPGGFNFAPEETTSPAPLHSIPEDWEILSDVAEMSQRQGQTPGDVSSGNTFFAGWPCLSVGGHAWTSRPLHSFWSASPPEERLAGAFAIHRVSDSGNARSSYAIPYTPIWPGFAINTLFYAAALWLFFCGPSTLRRAIRRRRGQCPACAYPVGVSDVCTECGKPLLKRGRGVDQA